MAASSVSYIVLRAESDLIAKEKWRETKRFSCVIGSRTVARFGSRRARSNRRIQGARVRLLRPGNAGRLARHGAGRTARPLRRAAVPARRSPCDACALLTYSMEAVSETIRDSALGAHGVLGERPRAAGSGKGGRRREVPRRAGSWRAYGYEDREDAVIDRPDAGLIGINNRARGRAKLYADEKANQIRRVENVWSRVFRARGCRTRHAAVSAGLRRARGQRRRSRRMLRVDVGCSARHPCFRRATGKRADDRCCNRAAADAAAGGGMDPRGRAARTSSGLSPLSRALGP